MSGIRKLGKAVKYGWHPAQMVKAEKLKRITDFFMSREVGEICARADFPSLHPEVDNKIPADAKFNWLGWDFIKGNDIGKTFAELNHEFLNFHLAE